MLLSACLGAPVSRGGRHVGRLVDLEGAPDATSPVVVGIVVRPRRGAPARIPWSEVQDWSPHRVVLAEAAGLDAAPVGVLLARDVLDAQLVDVAGRRVVRVADVDLRRAGTTLRVEGVQVGLDAVLRRLGLNALARRTQPQRIAWPDLHLPAHPGAALTLERAAPALSALPAHERARLASRLSARAAAVLRAPGRLIHHRYPIHLRGRHRATP